MPRNRFSQIQAQLRQFLLLDLYWSYSQLNHLSLNMVHHETINKGITLNDVSFLLAWLSAQDLALQHGRFVSQKLLTAKGLFNINKAWSKTWLVR